MLGKEPFIQIYFGGLCILLSTPCVYTQIWKSIHKKKRVFCKTYQTSTPRQEDYERSPGPLIAPPSPFMPTPLTPRQGSPNLPNKFFNDGLHERNQTSTPRPNETSTPRPNGCVLFQRICGYFICVGHYCFD